MRMKRTVPHPYTDQVNHPGENQYQQVLHIIDRREVYLGCFFLSQEEVATKIMFSQNIFLYDVEN